MYHMERFPLPLKCIVVKFDKAGLVNYVWEFGGGGCIGVFMAAGGILSLERNKTYF